MPLKRCCDFNTTKLGPGAVKEDMDGLWQASWVLMASDFNCLKPFEMDGVEQVFTLQETTTEQCLAKSLLQYRQLSPLSNTVSYVRSLVIMWGYLNRLLVNRRKKKSNTTLLWPSALPRSCMFLSMWSDSLFLKESNKRFTILSESTQWGLRQGIPTLPSMT